MRKKSLLALLLAAMMLLSGCALVVVDQDADNARIIVDVNGETVNKLTVHRLVDNQISEYEQMNQLYAMLYGVSNVFPTDHATIEAQVIDAYVNSLVAQQKAAALGFDQMTDEELAQIEETAQENYHEFLHQVADAYIDGTDLDEEALEAKAEEYVLANGLSTKDDFVQYATTEKMIEKLRADAVKDVTVSEDELNESLSALVSSDQAAFDANPDQYGYTISNGGTVYYAPAGYRYVKHILVNFTEEDAAAITEKTTAQTAAQAALASAQAALEAAGEDADAEALQAAVDEAQAALDAATAELEAAQETARQNIKEKVDEIYALATAEGADFDALIAEYNEDPGEPAEGYAIREGYAYFVEPFTNAGMALENVGDVSEPVESSYGYHIIQYSADIPEGAVSLDSVREALEADMLASKQTEAYNAALAAWVAEANVKTYPERMD